MSNYVVSMKVPMARGAVTALRSEVAAIDRMRDRLPEILALADDPSGTTALVNLAFEVSEETAGLATVIEDLANLSEAIDNGSVFPLVLQQLEETALGSLTTLRDSIYDDIGSSGSHQDLLDAIGAGIVNPSAQDQAAYDLAVGLAGGDFDLADSIFGGPIFPDKTTNVGTRIDVEGVEHISGGAILGPDGRYYPIVIPVVTGPDGNQYTTGFDEPGWTPIGYTNGTEQFASDLTPGQKLLVSIGVGTGLDIPATTSDDGLPGLVYRNGQPPILTQVPGSSDAINFPGFSDLGPKGGAADLAVGAVQGITTFNNLNENVDRAYEVVFEQNEETGAIRSRVTTHSVGVGGDGQTYVTANHVFVTEDNELAQTPAVYAPQPDAPQGPPGIESAPVVPLRDVYSETSRPHRVGGPLEVQ